MSTTPVTPTPTGQSSTPTPAPTLSGLLNIQRYLNAVGVQTAQGIEQVSSDLSAGDKASAVNDAVLTAAKDVATIDPAQAGNVNVALSLFATGETIIVPLFHSIVGLFHHSKPAKP